MGSTRTSEGGPEQDQDGFSWGRVLSLFRGHRRQLSLVVGLVLLVSVLGIVNPLVMRVVFDDGPSQPTAESISGQPPRAGSTP